MKKLEALLAVSICLTAASLPMPITISWVLLLINLAVWVIYKISARKAQPLAFGPLTIPIAVYAVVVTISGAPDWNLHDAFKSLTSLRACLIYFIAYDVLANSPKLKPIAIACMLSVAAVSGIWGSIQQIFDWHPVGYKWLQGTGFQSGPMAFAGQMQIFSLLSLGFLLMRGYRNMPKPLQCRSFFSLMCLANVAGIMFASERSAWLGFIIAIAVFVSLLSRKLMLRSSVVAIVALTFSWFCIPVVKKRLLPLLDWRHEVSSAVRLKVWDKAIELFREHPVLGVGATKFPLLDFKDAIVPGRSENLNHAHSNYLQVLSTNGLVGMCAYAYLSIAIFVIAWRQYRYSNRALFHFNNVDKSIGFAVIGIMVSLMVSGLFEYNFGSGPVRLPLFFVLALLSWPKRQARESEAASN